jgi:hypothetical protein
MPMLENRAVVLAKEESTYGTDSTPSPTTDAILCEAPIVEPVGRKVERNFVRPYFGALPPINIGEAVKATITAELKGSGAAGTVPEIAPLLRGCGMDETIVPATSVTYKPNSNSTKSVTIYFYRHNIEHKILGARGTWSLEAKASEYAKLKFEFTGLYAGPVDGTMPSSPTFSAILPARFLSALFSFNAYSAVIETLKFVYGNVIAKRMSANSATGILEYFVKERKVTGDFDPEMPTIATHDFFGDWAASTAADLTAQFGSAAGNKCVIDAPHAVLDVMKYGARDNLLTLTAPFTATPSSTGDDEISLAFT